MSTTVRIVVAVIVGGIVGTFANAIIVAALIEGAAVIPLTFSPGRLTVAILVTILVPLVAFRLTGAAEAAVSIVLLTVVPSILAKLVFGLGAGWGFVLFVNLVYAVAAWLVYHLIAGWGRTPRLG